MVAVKMAELGDEVEARARLVPPRDEIAANHLADEQRLLDRLLERAVFSDDERRRSSDLARRLVYAARADRGKHAGVDAFMREYGLSSEEGIILMCIAEALLRIPDTETADDLIAEKIAGGHWEKHRGHSDNLFVNASTWALMLTGRVVKLREARGANPFDALKRLVARSGEPVIRQAVRQAVKVLGDQFVLGRTIREALVRAQDYEQKGYLFSYDMLGEAARTQKDADVYFERYLAAIDAIGQAAGPFGTMYANALYGRPGLSVKLSALHPRFEPGKEERLAAELVPRMLTLARAARARGLTITIDAEEQDRLNPTLEMFATILTNPALDNWHGLGLAVQAYGKRAIPTLRWLRRLAERSGKRIPVRLVKGAYWDSEIKWAQERALSDYPVFTRKLHTDVSYLACMRLLLSDVKSFHPQFATHNAYAIAAAHVAAGSAAFEFQRLHGMGEALYDEVVGDGGLIKRPCRIYAPVGGHEDLLAYLVRRLLENGANTSFVNRLADDEAPVSEIIRDPVEAAQAERGGAGEAQRLIVRPREIYLPERMAAGGVPLTESSARLALFTEMGDALDDVYEAGPIIGGKATTGADGASLVTCPHDRRERIGTVHITTLAQANAAIERATIAEHAWNKEGGAKRAQILAAAADLFERDKARLMAVVVREAGKTLEDAQADVREAVDYLRYYAAQARRLFVGPVVLPGPTGERNTLTLNGRGVFACISPWNFPLAIFTGQVAAALAAGNAVLAKPAEQTPITAFLATRLLHEAGVPGDVLHLLPGSGRLGEALVKDPRVKGISFTGSNETAWAIQMALANRRNAIVPFIAETGGLNAMIADSSALPEQVVRDAVRSAFNSAGQRCSAARVLFVQEEIADRTIDMLTGAIQALDIGDPFDYATDIGPVIDEEAQDRLDGHKVRMQREGRQLVDLMLPEACRAGSYVTPAAFEIDNLGVLEQEVFGPILHVVRYERGALDKVVAAINASGYGLTLGLHSRIEAVADYVAEHARVGNIYVNRNQIGAIVGVQPFGGEGLSGTGPKAGGPNTLFAYASERVRSTDVTATGGNLELLTSATITGR
ncbi:bifunctional proline dehydrogenase/L-glutamate gamma-semialdehyde dehydrogenase PutA [Hyphomicrobium sp.]|uniref:bifunctional proline dehydrogenase/L-glutamate gamma-semialdehyde dehydrogenase PutA n=1 Tax=Hyphomicrobium sp. TaxID=82 RepID=UPI0025C048CD|nr:bifunctional proline dehydrogenase/L-glutamate gamma-semialdehyde dehydrogenase PutA [Hyphomicrobium sp.]